MIRHSGAAIRATALQWGRVFLDLIFPPSCVGCGKAGLDWCDSCNENLRRLSEPACIHCGSPLPKRHMDCVRCTDFPGFLQIRSYAFYEGSLLRAILHLKYRPNKRLAQIMGNWLCDLAIREGMEADIILAVPLGRKRWKQRGYNQVDLIVESMAKSLGIARDTTALKRVRETKSQVGLDPHTRHLNVQNAFQADPKILQKQNVLLVDDLFTTGATLLACASALREVGVREVFGLTVARA